MNGRPTREQQRKEWERMKIACAGGGSGSGLLALSSGEAGRRGNPLTPRPGAPGLTPESPTVL